MDDIGFSNSSELWERPVTVISEVMEKIAFLFSGSEV